MHLTKSDIEQTERIKRLNIVNSVSGVKPANLIGTISDQGHPNLAIISSVIHLGSSPALLGFVMRPQHEVPKDTYQNVMACGYYTINHVPTSHVHQAHYTSAKFSTGVSEFDKCQFTEEYIKDFEAPFVKESPLKIGMKYLESVSIELNKTILIIGEIAHLMIPDHCMDEAGHLDLEMLGTAGISGLNTYYELARIGQFPYARPEELPDFD